MYVNQQKNILKNLAINILKFVLFLGVGVAILYFVFQNLNEKYVQECIAKGNLAADCKLMDKIIADFKSVNYFWILVTLICYTISNISRTVRWNALLKPLGCQPRFINSFLTIMIGYGANLLLPRLGEVMRPAYFARYEKLAFEKVMGTTVVDRILDLISIVLVTAFAMLLEYERIWNFLSENLGDKVNNLLNSSFIIVAPLLMIAFVGLIYVNRKRLAKLPFFTKVKNILKGFWDGLISISKVDKPLWFIFHSINIWVMYFLMMRLAFYAFEPTVGLPAVAGLIAFVFGAWGIVIPSPGGMGSFHVLTIAALALYGIDYADAFSFSNISFFSIQLGINALFAVLAVILIPIVNKNYKPILHQKDSDNPI